MIEKTELDVIKDLEELIEIGKHGVLDGFSDTRWAGEVAQHALDLILSLLDTTRVSEEVLNGGMMNND